MDLSISMWIGNSPIVITIVVQTRKIFIAFYVLCFIQFMQYYNQVNRVRAKSSYYCPGDISFALDAHALDEWLLLYLPYFLINITIKVSLNINEQIADVDMTFSFSWNSLRLLSNWLIEFRALIITNYCAQGVYNCFIRAIKLFPGTLYNCT